MCCGVDPSELDLARFERLVAQARGTDPESSRQVLSEALALWRGPPLADLAYEPFAQPEIVRLEELRLAAVEQRIDAELAAGRHADVVGELERLVREHPLRERLHGQLMLCLYRAGRQAEALEAFRTARAVLVEELGIEPGRSLRQLHEAILAQDPRLDLPVEADRGPHAARDVRRPRARAGRAGPRPRRRVRRPREPVPPRRRARRRQESARRGADRACARPRRSGARRPLLGSRGCACLLAVGAVAAAVSARRRHGGPSFRAS